MTTVFALTTNQGDSSWELLAQDGSSLLASASPAGSPVGYPLLVEAPGDGTNGSHERLIPTILLTKLPRRSAWIQVR